MNDRLTEQDVVRQFVYESSINAAKRLLYYEGDTSRYADIISDAIDSSTVDLRRQITTLTQKLAELTEELERAKTDNLAKVECCNVMANNFNIIYSIAHHDPKWFENEQCKQAMKAFWDADKEHQSGSCGIEKRYELERLHSKLAELEQQLPDTYYAGLPFQERLHFMVNDWRRSVVACQRADEKLAELEREREASRLALRAARNQIGCNCHVEPVGFMCSFCANAIDFIDAALARDQKEKQ